MNSAPVYPSTRTAEPKRLRAERLLPDPRECLAGCLWLPRILAKARLARSGALPREYLERFCQPTGVDGQFLSFFGIGCDELMAVAEASDAGVATWFNGLPQVKPERIAAWNKIAGNLGLSDRLPFAKATAYRDHETEEVETVFELLQSRAGARR